MATARNMVPRGAKPPSRTPDDQLRRDRIAAAVVLTVLIVMMAVLIWLASIGGHDVPDNLYDFWPMMP